jgi:acetyl coenzyme A synthetase (ADP forming)-like protein
MRETLALQERTGLEVFFAPQGVAILGASRDASKLNHGIVCNLVEHGYPGPIYPVNPRAKEILGLRCYPSILAVPDPVDLAVIVLPAPLVPQVLEECGQRGLKGAVVISSGFREVGGRGAQLEEQLVEIAHRCGMRLIGPNCVGVIDTVTPLDTSFVATMPLPGRIAFLSQSGAICGGLIDWTRSKGVGFSRFVSLGNEADVTETDLLEFLGRDPHTKVVAAYLEGIQDGARFMAVARQVARHTPFVVLKTGGTRGGAQAALSHTGALSGSEQALRTALRQCGALQVESLNDLFDQALALACQPPPQGDQIAVLTNAGGPGVLAADGLEREGLRLAPLSEETMALLLVHLPPEASVQGPVDLLGSGRGPEYALALEALLKDPQVHGVIVIHVPPVHVSPEKIAEAIGDTLSRSAVEKPVLACFLGEASVREAIKILHRHRIPPYTFPEQASRAMGALRRYRRWLERPLSEAQPLPDVNRRLVKDTLVQTEGRQALESLEALRVLEAYRLPVARAGLARTAEEAAALAEEIGCPVALKIVSPDILHKSDLGGVALDLPHAAAVREAFASMVGRVKGRAPEAWIQGVLVQKMAPRGREVIVGLSRDPQFGPLLMFGLGGLYVEVLEDVSSRIAPISYDEALAMIQEVRSFPILREVRGERPVDLEAIADCLVRVSQLAVDFPQIAELDINPLVVGEKGAVAVDARLILAGARGS